MQSPGLSRDESGLLGKPGREGDRYSIGSTITPTHPHFTRSGVLNMAQGELDHN